MLLKLLVPILSGCVGLLLMAAVLAGLQAAAATAIGMQGAAPGRSPPRPMVFRADHPFLVLIRHEKSGAILSIGRVANPQG